LPAFLKSADDNSVRNDSSENIDDGDVEDDSGKLSTVLLVTIIGCSTVVIMALLLAGGMFLARVKSTEQAKAKPASRERAVHFDMDPFRENEDGGAHGSRRQTASIMARLRSLRSAASVRFLAIALLFETCERNLFAYHPLLIGYY
jgi:flagellar basal body-associated protein FliL